MRHNDTTPKRKYGPRKIRPSRLQLQLAALLVTDPGITLCEAMAKVGYSKSMARHHAHEAIVSPGQQVAIQQQLAKAGITDERVLGRLNEALDYTDMQRIKVGSAQDGNERIEEFSDVDNANRLKAVELVARMRGWIKSEQGQQTVVVFLDASKAAAEMYVPEERRAEYLRFIGAKVVGAS
jgi:hypothetical protein